MSIPAILAPVFAQVALTFALLFWMGHVRFAAVRAGEVKVKDVALGQRAWPDRVQQVANAFHNQFETLRASGKYAGMQKVIRNRDVALQGSINPVLAQFGASSEARQYSGMAVDANWKCPFQRTEEPVGARG